MITYRELKARTERVSMPAARRAWPKESLSFGFFQEGLGLIGLKAQRVWGIGLMGFRA